MRTIKLLHAFKTMIKDKLSFKKSLERILLEEGLCLDAGGLVFIRSLEGDFWCVGYLDKDGGIQSETEFPRDMSAAIDYFFELIDENELC